MLAPSPVLVPSGVLAPSGTAVVPQSGAPLNIAYQEAAMSLTLQYIQGADLPDAAFTWTDRAGALIDFSSGWTFVLKIGTPGKVATLTKNSGIIGAATDPNVTVAWDTSGELNTLPPGMHTVHLTATRTADSKQRVLRCKLRIYPAIT